MNKGNILFYFILAVFGLLALRLFQLQIVDHEKYKKLAKNNTSKTLAIRAPRGIIYARDGNILSTSKQSLSVIILPSKLKDKETKIQVAKTLSNFVPYYYEDLRDYLLKLDPRTPLPVLLEDDVDIETVIKIYENKNFLPGVYVDKQAVRYYPYKNVAAHLLGYVGQINEAELNKRKIEGLHLGSIVGKDGLEKVLDRALRGINGEARVAVDRYGRSVENEEEKVIVRKATKGRDLQLTIDIDLQQVAYEALKDLQGAAAVINPKNGEVLALVSTPSFDPNIFTKPVPAKVYNEILEKKAFLNKSISSYPPGSIWKPVSSLVILEKNLISPHEKLPVSGSVFFNGFKFGDWTSKEDMMDLREAIAWSRNTYFYQLAKKMQVEWLEDMGRNFGIGEKTGIEILGESSGVLPSPEWKKKNMAEPWFPGNTLHYSIGQSFLLISPLQAARYVGGLANKGYLPQIHMIKNKKKEKLLKPRKKVTDKSYEIVQEGMLRCVKSGTGTWARPWGSKVKIAGKTGSAEVPGYKKSTHAWFVGYAPADDPQIALAIFAEGAGHGGSIAAPVAQKIFAKFFEKYGYH